MSRPGAPRPGDSGWPAAGGGRGSGFAVPSGRRRRGPGGGGQQERLGVPERQPTAVTGPGDDVDAPVVGQGRVHLAEEPIEADAGPVLGGVPAAGAVEHRADAVATVEVADRDAGVLIAD